MTTAVVRPTPELAAEADARFEDIADPVEQALAVLRWAGETFGDDFAITSSMADGLLAHLASTAVPGVRVVFLDTGYHFAETIGTRDWITSVLPITLVNVEPARTVAQRTSRSAPGCSSATPTCAAPCARYGRWPSSCRATSPGARASAATRAPPVRGRGSSTGTRHAAC